MPTQSTRLIASVRSRKPAWIRSIRAAVVVPSVFAIACAISPNSQFRLFAAFGSFALMVFAVFAGSPRVRLRSYGILFATGAVFMVLGTLCSAYPVLAVAGMAIVGFAVLFAGVASRQAATGAMAALLTFVLPVSLATPPSDIPVRLGGWLLAGAIGIPAAMLAPRFRDPLRTQLAVTARALAGLATAHARGETDLGAREAAEAAVAELLHRFEATTYRPTGTDTTVAKLVGRLEWVAFNAIVEPEEAASLRLPEVARVNQAAADVLAITADLVAQERFGPEAADRLAAATAALDAARDISLAAAVAQVDPVGVDQALDDGQRLLAALDPTFRARALSFAVDMVAEATLRRGPREIWRLLAAHIDRRSVWLRNSLRGAAGLSLAVTVVEITAVEHGFWVILGALSVLRSSALGTGATALRALAGTTAGFVVGSAIMVGLADHYSLLWAVLPVAVLLAGVATSVAAGQAGFTVVVVILFSIIQPVGWRVGLTRVEDVAIGCGVSLVVGVLLWPRGATAALGRALSDAFSLGSAYLVGAVDRVISLGDDVSTEPARLAAEAAHRRLDDAVRQYLSERGTKRVPVKAVTDLFTGTVRTRLAAQSLATLPLQRIVPEEGVVVEAGASLHDSCEAVHRWYLAVGEMLAGRGGGVPPVPPHDPELHRLMATAYVEACQDRRPDDVRVALRILWADESVHDQLNLQRELAGAAERFAGHRAI